MLIATVTILTVYGCVSCVMFILCSHFTLNIINVYYIIYNNIIRLNYELFQGAREVKDFINFLKREASKPLVINGVKEEL